MKALFALPVGILALGGYVYLGSHLAHAVQAHHGGVHVEGNGIFKTQNRSVGSFTKIVVGSSFEGDVFEGQSGPLTIGADSNILPMIETRIDGDTLYVTTKGSMRTHSPLKITARTKVLRAADLSGAAQINIKNVSKHELRIKGSGASKIQVFGAPTSLTTDLSGATQLRLGVVNLLNLTANLSGASTLQLNGMVKVAKIDASGASHFKGPIKGSKVEVKASGASSVQLGGHFDVSAYSSTGASSISPAYDVKGQ